MRKFYVLIFVITSLVGYSQEVTTVLDSPEADIDDALALDSRGNLYGSNFFGDSVYKITRSGEVSVFVSGLANPNGLAFDRQDNLYIAEYSASRINKYNRNGDLLKSFPVEGIPSGMIRSLYRNTIIYTDVRGDDSINELLPDGTSKVLFKGAPLNDPVGLAFDRRGTLYIGNFSDRKIYKLLRGQTNLEYVATVPDSGTDSPFLAFITYANGFLYGTNYGEHKIYKINPRKVDKVTIFAGSVNGNTDGDLSEATFSYPAGIISNRLGNTLYVSEFSGVGNVRKISGRSQISNFNFTLKLSPNPARDLLNIQLNLENDGDFRIKIYQLIGGNLVFESQEFYSQQTFTKQIDIKNWRNGMYILKVIKDGESHSRVFIKR